MPMGPGKYDPECTEVMMKNRAEVVLLMVLGGQKGSGFAITVDNPFMILELPKILREIADDIEKNGAETPTVQ